MNVLGLGIAAGHDGVQVSDRLYPEHRPGHQGFTGGYRNEIVVLRSPSVSCGNCGTGCGKLFEAVADGDSQGAKVPARKKSQPLNPGPGGQRTGYAGYARVTVEDVFGRGVVLAGLEILVHVNHRS